MALVDYQDSCTSSDTEDDDEVPEKTSRSTNLSSPPLKRALLPTAATLLGVKKPKPTDEDSYDDPTQHDGRIRSFKHERGNWATYICVPVKYELLDFLVLEFQAKSKTLLTASNIDLKPIDDLHISLSRTVVLQYHLIDSFMQTLENALINSVRFSVTLQRIKIYTNEEKTRTFVALQVDNAYNGKMKELLSKIDVVMNDFRLPVFYTDPSFHISLMWCLGDQLTILQTHLSQLEALIAEQVEHEGEILKLNVNELRFKSGNKNYTFKLK